MEEPHLLKSLLQLQLGSDASAVLHLPFVLETINPDILSPSPHTHKWTARINYLLHSKDAGARWAGLSLALRTAICSKAMMMECAQSWLGVALPSLSKEEPQPTLKASIRLLRRIFSSATDVTEFQRQLCVPNMPKFTAALVALDEKQSDAEVLALATLTHLIPLYPTLHRSLHASLSSLALKHLNGSTPNPTPVALVEAASKLYSTLHVTGGKVGATSLWRKSLDETLSFAWGAFFNLRRTFPSAGNSQVIPQAGPSTNDPVILVPLSLDRLRAASRVLCDLLHSSTARPVLLPVGSLVNFVAALLRCSPDERVEATVDPPLRAMEVSVIPVIWELACDLIISLTGSARLHLVPHLSQLLSHLSYHLEQPRTARQRLHFLRATASLLQTESYLYDAVLSSRLARAILPFLTPLLATKTQQKGSSSTDTSKSTGKRGKKRARGYEGDEVFKVAMEIICPTAEEGEVLLVAADAVKLVFRVAQITPPVRSLVTRVLLAIYIALPHMQPALISPDLSLHGRLYARVRDICGDLASGNSSTMSKSLGLVIGTMSPDYHHPCGADVMRDIELLLHPRVPPLVRSLPHVETLSLFREEEGEEELSARQSLGLSTANDTLPLASADEQDVQMTITAPVSRPEAAFQDTAQASSRPLHTAPSDRSALTPATGTAPQFIKQFVAATPTPWTPGGHATVTTQNSQSDAPLMHPQQFDASPPQDDIPATPEVQSKTPGVSSTLSSEQTRAIPPPTSIPPVSSTSQGFVATHENEEDEPMPSINMDSDSDEES
ncbi:uncharacterized protein LAESUDRAFT_754063 [Laetiporus sulphureus 93-53]|uniref:Pre-rRNA-processing protein RIX1 n=1 Tax=Laetiporus sulphureus 93-53 TaxID=1314785 RepID=A0A165IGE9_9APHY|nr:uncharacterized protein LAESUDRAFT_754063 [Laetiporus sulphureus 93-53]KZT13037.1 hypothetical protein LAESUDRAFT_754063 [Laetiporus sulphureus 93-53]